MYCPGCKAAVAEQDRFCPKCGMDMTMPMVRPTAPLAPPPAVATTPQTPRATVSRLPLADGGTKYAGLNSAAKLLIRGGAVLRILAFVVGGLTAISIYMRMQETPNLGIVLGLLAGGVIAIIGWSVSLLQTVVGELMYVIVDVEEAIRRRV